MSVIGVILKILGVLAGAIVALAFAAGALLGVLSRGIAAAFASGWRGPERPKAPPDAITRRGLKVGALGAIAGLAILGAIAGGVVFVSGIVPIKASLRHWPITEWFLHTGMERSVATHSIGIEAPSFDDPDLVLKGAGHYEIGCRPCHGSPGLIQPRIAHMMTPQPPDLPPRIGNWDDAGLFYLVKHGVKFTGMPAWPALRRDDEVWAMVAFLRKLPGLDEASYRRLAYGDPPPAAPMEAMEGAEQVPSAALQTCARCHGPDGIARGDGAFPHLAGQHAEYLEKTLHAYAASQRHSGIMQPIAANLDAGTIAALSQFYASRPPPKPKPPATSAAEAAAIERGRLIAQQGIPAQRLPSCVECHEPEGRRHKPAFPSLAGQPADYLVLQLELLKNGYRGGSEYVHLMHAVAPRMNPEQMRDVAKYFESLPPARK